MQENVNSRNLATPWRALSYSSKDKELAGQLKAELEGRGFTAFLAHEDIKPTKEWESEIF
ncbi:unnamed protein product, partial [marine sediment metagenome]